jgi:hypothetical protein
VAAGVRFDDSALLGEARTWLREQASGKGAACPCCTQFTKVYRRTLNAGMARSLVTMYRTAGLDWQHVPTTTIGGSREEGKLKYWGLVEEADERHGGQRAGWWRVTETGEAFLKGELQVPRWALVFDSRCLGFDDQQTVSVYDALGDHFNYAALMETPAE